MDHSTFYDTLYLPTIKHTYFNIYKDLSSQGKTLGSHSDLTELHVSHMNPNDTQAEMADPKIGVNSSKAEVPSLVSFGNVVRWTVNCAFCHSEEFKMNRNGNTILIGKKYDLFLI